MRATADAQFGLVGRSERMESVRRLIAKAAHNRLPVLLLGESGTGKEIVARAIHYANSRGQLVPIDCGSLVGTLMESELFGHVRGAFSGAIGDKKGLVELADGGTAFFDEIGDLPLELQVKLLRLIQEREFRPVGALRWRQVDLRVIAATHRDLKAEVAAGRFRQDLYYRLNVFTIRLPALRERREDIPLLIEHFLELAGAAGLSIGPEFENALAAYDWPGNVRELRNCVEKVAALNSGNGLRIYDFPSEVQNHLAGATPLDPLSSALADSGGELAPVQLRPRSPVISIPDCEKQAIAAALASTNGERQKAAQMLGIGRTTLYRKMKQYRID